MAFKMAKRLYWPDVSLNDAASSLRGHIVEQTTSAPNRTRQPFIAVVSSEVFDELINQNVLVFWDADKCWHERVYGVPVEKES